MSDSTPELLKKEQELEELDEKLEELYSLQKRRAKLAQTIEQLREPLRRAKRKRDLENAKWAHDLVALHLGSSVLQTHIWTKEQMQRSTRMERRDWGRNFNDNLATLITILVQNDFRQNTPNEFGWPQWPTAKYFEDQASLAPHKAQQLIHFLQTGDPTAFDVTGKRARTKQQIETEEQPGEGERAEGVLGGGGGRITRSKSGHKMHSSVKYHNKR